MIRIVEHAIDPADVLAAVASPLAGAVVLFLGTTRQVTKGRETLWLDYQCYGPMAEKQLAELAETARGRWPLIACAIVHRVGRVGLGEASVAIAVSSPHRQDAFEAGQWLIDTLKQVVPIWKQENWADGTTEWVHPGLEPPASPTGSDTARSEVARSEVGRNDAAADPVARDDGNSRDTSSESQR